MHIIFDLAGTVFGLLDMSVRPGIKDTIEEIRAAGFQVDFWTSGNVESYSALLQNSGIEGRVYSKCSLLPFEPDICVDDDPYGLIPGRLVKVRPYVAREYPCDIIDVTTLIGGKAA